MKIIPDIVKPRPIRSLPGAATIGAAAEMMAQNRISAVLVIDDGSLVGIVTERDITRAFAKRLSPDDVLLSEIMTREPEVVAPDDDPRQALALMEVRDIRHLPVVANGAVVGIVSLRDLMGAINRRLENAARQTQRYIFGDRYG